MEVFEHDYRTFENARAGDERLPVRFYMGAIKDEESSAKEGRPIFRDVECIQIYQSKDNVIDRPIRDTDKERWPRAYAAWKNTGDSEPGAGGTRLEHWPQMTRAQVEEFKYFKIFTVEQLAELPDSIVQKIMGAPQLKAKALIFVEAAKSDAPFLRLQGEIQKRDGEIASLKEQIAQLTALVQDKLGEPA